MSEPAAWLRAGVVGRPHGLDGSFHLNDSVPGLLTVGLDVRVGDEPRRIERLAGHDARPILRLAGFATREAADGLRGSELMVAQRQAPVLEEDEWWAADLEGCAVHDSGREVGVVARLLALPSCEVLEVRRGDGERALLVPLVKDAVRGVDTGARVIDIDLRFLGEE
ncbi:MAG: ribosome maturation factor RimM [Solirubrobacteraceae bacterium]